MKPTIKHIDQKIARRELRSIPTDQLLARYDAALKAHADATLDAECGSANRKPAAQRLLNIQKHNAGWIANHLWYLCTDKGLIKSPGIDPLA